MNRMLSLLIISASCMPLLGMDSQKKIIPFGPPPAYKSNNNENTIPSAPGMEDLSTYSSHSNINVVPPLPNIPPYAPGTEESSSAYPSHSNINLQNVVPLQPNIPSYATAFQSAQTQQQINNALPAAVVSQQASDQQSNKTNLCSLATCITFTCLEVRDTTIKYFEDCCCSATEDPRDIKERRLRQQHEIEERLRQQREIEERLRQQREREERLRQQREREEREYYSYSNSGWNRNTNTVYYDFW